MPDPSPPKPTRPPTSSTPQPPSQPTSQPPSQPPPKPAPTHAFGSSVPWLLVAVACAALLVWFFPTLGALQGWVIAVTAVTVLLFGWDKLAAGRRTSRVPELELLLFCLAGGTVGAPVAMNLVQHKTTKTSFR